MSIENASQIDGIGVEKETNKVLLVISDHLGWDDVQYHMSTLKKKMDCYFSFISSGELLTKYPLAKGKQVKIAVIGKHSVPPQAIEFCNQISRALSKHEIAIVFQTSFVES